MSLFGPYLPVDRCKALVAGQTLPDHTVGAALFADIAGFSPLTKALTQELGPQRGVEELSITINGIYETLITEVRRYGGEVIAFGGDAITCWFDQDDGARAVTCALNMQEVMRPHTTLVTSTGRTLHISLKISITVGPARRFVVGDPAIQQIDTLAGRTLERVALAEAAAQQGEILLDAVGAAALLPHIQSKTWRKSGDHSFVVAAAYDNPSFPIIPEEMVPLEDELARPWLLAPVYERLKRGEAEFLTELRLAIAMFVAFSGLDYDEDAAAGQKLDQFIRWVQGVLARYGGDLIDLSMGDKGSHLYAVFGALVAHEDDPVRAVMAALALQHPPPECDFVRNIRIGISRGRMRCGITGSKSRRTYGVHGGEVNVAAYLMTQAEPGQILLTKRIVTAPGHSVSFQRIGERPFKGDDAPLELFTPQPNLPSPTAALMAPAAAQPLVGRERECTLVAGLLRQLLHNPEGRYAVFIEGEAGIGKSHLLKEVALEARQMGLKPLIGEANAIEKSTPYYAWRNVFTQLLLRSAPPGVNPETPEAWREHLYAQIETTAPFAIHLAPLLNPVLALDLPESEMTQGLVGEIRANNTRWMLVAMLQKAAAQAPLLLLFEDMHWLDSASWALLLAVHQVVQPLLTVMTLRPLTDLALAEYASLRQQPRSYYLPLGSLQPPQIEAMVCQNLGSHNLPPLVAQLIHNKAEGHPFFSRELAFTLRDAGFIQIQDHHCTLTPGAEERLRQMNFPDTIEGVITSRIDLLPSQQQLALKVGSVIGRAFAYQTLHDVHPVEADKPELHNYLNGLKKLNVLTQLPQEADTAYLFSHILIQEVAYNLLTFAQRRQLHQQIALWYEQIYRGDKSSYYPLLAHHWIHAGNIPKAIENLEEAGQQAARSFANDEVIAFFKQALALVAQSDYQVEASRRASWELLLGEAYVHRSQYLEGQRHLEAGVALLGHPVVSRGRIAWGLLKELGRQLAYRYLPKSFHGKSVTSPDSVRAAARAYNRLTEVYYFNGESYFSTYTCIRATNLGEVVGVSPELAEAYAVMASATSLMYLFKLSDWYARRALHTAQQCGEGSAQASTFMVIGAYYNNIGYLAESERLLRELVSITEQMGDYRRYLDGLHWLGRTVWQKGDFVAGLLLAQELDVAAARRSQPRFQALAAYNRAVCLLHLGQTADALAILHPLSQILAEGKIVETPLQREVMGLMVLAHIRMGQYDEAMPLAQELVLLTSSVEAHTYANLAVGYALELFLTIWEQEGRTLADLIQKAQANHLFFARAYRVGQPYAWLLRGRLAWLEGKQQRARRYWHKALGWAEKNGMNYLRGRVHAEIARHSSPGSPEQQHHHTQAQAIFTQIKAQHDLDNLSH